MKSKLTAIVVLVATANAGLLWGQSKEMTPAEIEAYIASERREVLKGLPGVSVIAGYKSPAASNENRRLKTAIELRLRQHGIPIFEHEEDRTRTPGSPFLFCGVTYRFVGNLLVARTDVRLHENARLARTSEEVIHVSWESTLGGDEVVDSPTFESARTRLLEVVDEFCNEYLAANPKKKP